MLERIDTQRLDAAHSIVEYIIPRVDSAGLFHPEHSLWAESGVYRAQLAGTLSVTGKLLNNDACIEAAKRILYRMMEVRIDKLWGVDWWWDHAIESPPKNWREDNKTIEEGYTAPTNLFDLGLYYKVSKDDSILKDARESMQAMFDRWDYSKGNFHHMTLEHAALASWVWQDVFPEFSSQQKPIIEWVISRFVQEAPKDFPFMTAVRTVLLLATTGTTYLKSVIKPGIDSLLADPSRRYSHNHNDFRHNESTFDHVNNRANIAVAILMKHFDLAAEETVYTKTSLYSYLSNWIDNMKAPGGSYFECKDIKTNRKFGQGSPAHYIPLWWILGARIP